MSTTIIDRVDLLTLNEASRRLPGRPHRATIWRWIASGVMTPAGRVRLESVRLGRRVLIAPEAIDGFAAKLAEAADGAHRRATVAPPTRDRLRANMAASRSTRAAEAEREAEALGI